jgi:hypothetical protein
VVAVGIGDEPCALTVVPIFRLAERHRARRQRPRIRRIGIIDEHVERLGSRRHVRLSGFSNHHHRAADAQLAMDAMSGDIADARLDGVEGADQEVGKAAIRYPDVGRDRGETFADPWGECCCRHGAPLFEPRPQARREIAIRVVPQVGSHPGQWRQIRVAQRRAGGRRARPASR